MEKKKYQIPALTVVALQQQAALMQSSTNQNTENYQNPDEIGPYTGGFN